jgi:NAD(P)-dependent dehydrogenase (short-subunit alcohol dehydrogenase family)
MEKSMGKAQVVLVTGATTGIGRETALHLARLGHRVFATGRRADVLEELQEEASGLPLETFLVDLNDAASIDAAPAEVAKRTDGTGLDVLVNNAGFGLAAPMELITDEDLRAQFETNVFGLVRLTQLFAAEMRERRSGKIVNVGSVVGKVALPMQGIYCATKHALEALTDALRMELASFGVHVALVEPGNIVTNFDKTLTGKVSAYEEKESPYRPAMATYLKAVKTSYRSAPGPACIAKTVVKIIRARRPRARYVSPFSTRIVIWLKQIIPTSWMDAIMRRVMGLTPSSLLGSDRK